MSHPSEQEVANRLVCIATDAFNRSINALEDAGALDTTTLRRHYSGIGSRYYDIVTVQIERACRSGAPWICELFPEEPDASDKR